MKNKKVIYTAIFGNYDNLQDPAFMPSNFKFICFTDQDFESDIWEIRKVKPPVPGDMTRSARNYKILPHKYLKNFSTSVWVDGNILVKGNVNKLLDKYLHKSDLAVYPHKGTGGNDRTCIYQEGEALIDLYEKRIKYKDKPEVIKLQMEQYRKEGYPKNNGLVASSVLLRNHHCKDLIRAMNLWWSEVKTKSKRDQMSFNYVAWKTSLDFTYISGDGWDNEYFYRIDHRESVFSRLKSKLRQFYEK